MYRSTLSLTLALDEVVDQCHAPAAVYPGKTEYPLYRRLGGPRDLSGRVRTMLPHWDSIPGPSRLVMGKLQPAGQTRPLERFYPSRDMIPNLTNEKKMN
jgi:hypothetical protein